MAFVVDPGHIKTTSAGFSHWRRDEATMYGVGLKGRIWAREERRLQAGLRHREFISENHQSQYIGFTVSYIVVQG